MYLVVLACAGVTGILVAVEVGGIATVTATACDGSLGEKNEAIKHTKTEAAVRITVKASPIMTKKILRVRLM